LATVVIVRNAEGDDREGTVEELVDEGMGQAVLVLHGGMGDSGTWQAVTDRLRDRFRTVRLHRRQYRLDVPRKVTMADEVDQVREVAATLDRPVLVGHSSGAVLALEALVADPGSYRAAVLYEPPLVLDEPLGGAKLEPARAALARGKAGTAFGIFLRDVAKYPRVLARVAAISLNRKPEWRDRIERQLDDNDAMDALGNRLAAYATIDVPVLLLAGDRSPAHLGVRLDALRQALPRTERVIMHGQGHDAQRTAPDRVAAAITRFADGLP
jgi:pimeloyl-ACP methyl ester carboxylesterase